MPTSGDLAASLSDCDANGREARFPGIGRKLRFGGQFPQVTPGTSELLGNWIRHGRAAGAGPDYPDGFRAFLDRILVESIDHLFCVWDHST